jgi:hypothetical protein
MRKAVLAAVLTLALPLSAQAVSYNAVAQFSLAGNPNGVWSYGYGVGGSSFNTMNVASVSCITYAGTSCFSVGGGLPIIGRNETASPITIAGTALIPTDVLWMHPGDADNLDSILRFTAPVAGDYSFAGAFSRLDFTGNGDGVVVSVFENGNLLFFNMVSPPIYDTSVAFGQTLTLSANDVLDFSVNRNAEYTYDSTGLSLVVSLIPEPGTLTLLSVGLAGLLVLRPRRG